MDRHELPPVVLIPGAGGAGRTWEAVRTAFDAALLPVPDEPDVPSMADAMLPSLLQLDRPPVVVGASLGAMVALELAHRMQVAALVLAAAGFGIRVSDQVLDRVAANEPGLLQQLARASIADRDNQEMVEFVAADFALRGQAVQLRHLRALAAYRPKELPAPPPAVILWGEHDRSIPLADHAELAMRCQGCLVPIAGAGHMPFYEAPEVTIRWIRLAQLLGS
jgi:pimeloyl-ACP methyl ester carboxylesterase